MIALWRVTKKIVLNKSGYFAVRGEKDDAFMMLLRAGNSEVAASVGRTK